MDQDLKRDIILDNYSHPFNKENIDKSKYSNYIYVNSNNSSCIDNIDLYILIEDDVIKDIKFDGEACAISTASTSIMNKALIGKTVSEATTYIENFSNMVDEKPYKKTMLDEAIVFDEIYKQANRKNCVMLPYKGILEALKKYNN